MSDTTGLLREPWEYLERQRDAGTFGIWVFLASEVLFFGALLLTYTVCRAGHPDAFAAAGRETNIWYGTINTAVLLTSSLTMAVASQAAASGSHFRHLVIACLAATAALGLAFLMIKGFEYKEDFDKHLVPGAQFALKEAGAQLFYGLYWLVTGVHAIHLAIGIVLVIRLALLGYFDSLRLMESGDRGHRPLLASSRRHLDFPLPTDLSAGTRMNSEPTKPEMNSWRLWRRNGLVWAALLLLLLLSLVLAYVPMGILTPIAGIAIAFAKAGLVILLFMELARSKALIRLAAMAGFVFLASLFVLTLADVLTRLGSG